MSFFLDIEDFLKRGRSCSNIICLNPGVKRCKRCYIERYCSRDSQVAHWKQHKATCNKFSCPESKPKIVLAGELCNIANGFKYIGQYDDALVEAQKALVITKDVYGENNVNTADIYELIASVLYKKGLHEEALIEPRKSLAIRREFRGENHESNTNIYEMIGCILVEQGRNDDALIGYGKALAIRIKLFGGDKHPDTARGYYNIGSVQFCKFQYKEALDSYRIAHTIYGLELGNTHPDTLDAASWIEEIELRQNEEKGPKV